MLLKLIRALAPVGRTFSLCPPWIIVGAFTVRIRALVVMVLPRMKKSRCLWIRGNKRSSNAWKSVKGVAFSSDISGKAIV